MSAQAVQVDPAHNSNFGSPTASRQLTGTQVSLGAIALMSDIAAAQRLPLRAAAFSSVLEQLNPTDGETVYLHAQRLVQAGKWDDALAP